MKKKLLKKLMVLALSAVTAFSAVPAATVTAAGNPYPTTQDVDRDGLYEIPCTRFAWQCVYDRQGIALPSWGNAVSWWQNAINQGYAVGNEPVPGSIAVWSGDYYGHVAYVTANLGNNRFTVDEGGRTDKDQTSSHGVAYGYTLTNAVGGRRPYDSNGLGDLQHFWAGETSADVSWSLGMYMSGFFPCMMFGIPGAALAMVRCAKPAKKKIAIGLVASAAICAFICGVTEPFEFGFMFLAPGLYVIYALLYGIFTMITVALGFRAGFSFSAGAMDLLFSSSLPAAQKTWLILPLGIAAFIVFYVVFLFAIKKFDLKTPGREDDDDLEAEKNIELANDDYTAIAAKILEGCGGKENITSIDNCITRLRLEVKDITAVNDKVIKSAGVAGVIKPGKTSVQVIIGTKVQFVADAFSALCK